MNISQLAQRIARHLDVPDPFNLPSAAALDVVNAINSGLQLFFTEAPSAYKRTTFSETLRAPIARNLTFKGQYSTELEGEPFDIAWYGCGIRANGMADDNEIAGISEVLDQWQLPNLSVQAQILFDCHTIPVSIERITSDVRAYQPGLGGESRTLKRQQQLGTRDWRKIYTPQPDGCPSYYKIEPTAIVRGGDIVCLMRVFPAPSVDTIIRFEAEVSASSFTVADLLLGSALPIAPAWVPLVIPLCEDAMTYSPLWKDQRTKGDIRENAINTIASRIKRLPNDLAVPDNTVLTPRGF
jgi:hypothetical protein